MEWPYLGTMTSPLWQMSYGEPEAALKDPQRRIGSMPLNNYDPEGRLVGAVLGHEDCPKCGTLMETVEVEVEELPIQQLRLCPECYLVTWNDENGFQSRRVFPRKKCFRPDGDSLGRTLDLPGLKLPEC